MRTSIFKPASVHWILTLGISLASSTVCVKSPQSCSILWTLWTVAHLAPLSTGFSRQGCWSGLPFPSPMHESEKSKWSHSVVSNSSRLHGLQPTRLLRPWDIPGKSTEGGYHCLLQLMILGLEKWSGHSSTRSNLTPATPESGPTQKVPGASKYWWGRVRKGQWIVIIQFNSV